tara:strand:+ start:544 stop:1098 length:555 start_codon:yes stop_codon:yes gene_type:complete
MISGSKKGALSLSITAIVVMVIAFVVLGLGLSLTRTIFKGAEEKLPEAFAVTKLEAQPTASNPITITGTVTIGRKKSKTMDVGFYNKGSNTAFGAKFAIQSCMDTSDSEVKKNLPSMSSISAKVGASESKGYSLILNENGLAAGTYICTIGVKCNSKAATAQGGQCPSGTTYYETQQFFLKVTA